MHKSMLVLLGTVFFIINFNWEKGPRVVMTIKWKQNHFKISWVWLAIVLLGELLLPDIVPIQMRLVTIIKFYICKCIFSGDKEKENK